jgi:hypothetical protein
MRSKSEHANAQQQHAQQTAQAPVAGGNSATVTPG